MIPRSTGIEATAHQFQQWSPKQHEARVIVVGHVFAVAIHPHSEAAHIDWRADYSALSYERITPPDTVEHRVRAVMADLGLVYGAFDFVITSHSRWVFLEVNPGGQYGWLEDVADIRVTATMADLLAQGAT